MSGIDDENQQFFVVVNDEGRHSIWPDFKASPCRTPVNAPTPLHPCAG